MSRPKIILADYQHADGRHALKISFRQHGQKIRLTLEQSCRPEDWDPEKQKVRGRGPEVKAINDILLKRLGRALEIKADYDFHGRALTQDIFRQEMQREASREDFLAFFEEEMRGLYARRIFGPAVLMAETRTLEKLRKWKGGPLLFSHINRRIIEQFDTWHQKELSARGFDGARERGKALKQIQKYLTRAEEQGKGFEDPFQNFAWPRYQRKQVWLEEEELWKMLNLFFEPENLRSAMKLKAMRDNMRAFDQARYTSDKSLKGMFEHLRCFLFQCFTGCRDSDLRRLSWDNIEEDLLVYRPHKTRDTSGKTVFLPLTEIHHSLMIPGPGPLVHCVSNQKYNKALKILAELAGIDKNLTSHAGRHTFGSRMAANGVSLVSLAELMGVTNIYTVMIYTHSSLEQQKKELLKAQEGYKKSGPN